MVSETELYLECGHYVGWDKYRLVAPKTVTCPYCKEEDDAPVRGG